LTILITALLKLTSDGTRVIFGALVHDVILVIKNREISLLDKLEGADVSK
jgi:hypothetical protein